MAVTNLTEEENQKNIRQLYCSAEFTERLHSELIFLAAVNIPLSITAFLGNFLILIALHKENTLHPPSKLLYRNLAITDLCVGIAAEPLYAAYLISVVNKRWMICYYTDLLRVFSGFLLCSVSLFTLTAISVDRLLALSLLLRYRQVVTLKRTSVSALSFWFLSIVGSSTFFWNALMHKWYQYIGTALSLVIALFSYTKIFFILRHNQSQVHSQVHVESHVSDGQLPNDPRYRKAVYSALWVQITMVICYLPFAVAVALTPERGMSLSKYLTRQFTGSLIYLNSSLNPLLYCWKVREVRQAKTVFELSCSAEFVRSLDGEFIFLSAVNIFLSIAAFLGNTLILVALHKETSLRPPSKLLYRNLAITDLCVGIISEPVAVTYWISVVNERWDICYYAYWAASFSSFILCAVSLFTLTAISVDRLLALLLGLRYRQVVTLRRTCITVTGFWILSIVSASTIFLNARITPWYQYIGTALCLVTTIFAYAKIFLTLRHNQIHVQSHAAQGQPSQAIPLNIARYRKAVNSALWVQGTVGICYLPYNIAIFLTPQRGMPLSIYLATNFTASMVLLNSSLNPLLYCWKIREVRQAVIAPKRKMALKNFTEDENHKTVQVLFCSAEFIRGVDGELIFRSALNIFLSITAFLGNTLILVALHKKTSLHPPSKLLYRNLAITDLCVGIIVEPLAVTYGTSVVKERWDICYYAYWAVVYSALILCVVSLLTMTAISVDRLLALLLGLRYRQVVTYRRTCITVTGFWFLSIVGASTLFLNRRITLWYQYIVTALCLVTTIFAYAKIFVTLRHNQIHVQNHVAQGQPSQAIPLNIARYRKAVYSALWLQGTLGICYLPYNIAVFLTPQRGMSLSMYLARNFTVSMVFLNSSLNPLLYCWKIREVRQAVKETLRQLCC
ncbi:unnamed protein product [Porites evermanni]|uniref:G-protein coupled receptors family 1 profile domain-containing protein n=1 Tax=Porites evermanni TaxID=104178 RepID=A0ABN8SLL1_9CNID|nr:unnamed protein product [Porites evermanni]